MSIDDTLAHFGIKGMKWGVRRKGNNIPASADATRAAEVRKLSKVGGKKALSNKDLQDYINRVNLERQFDQLRPSGQVKKFLTDLLVGEGKQEIKRIGKDQISKQVGDLFKSAK